MQHYGREGPVVYQVFLVNACAHVYSKWLSIISASCSRAVVVSLCNCARLQLTDVEGGGGMA